MSDSQPRTAAELFGEGKPPRDTRERILFTALNLFYGHGIHAVGLDRILSEVGVTKTTFYNHFPSKDHLVEEAVALRDEWELARFKAQVISRGSYEPRAMLLAMFDVLDSWFNDPAYRGCIFLTACAEFPSRKSPIHKVAAGHYVKAESDVRAMAKAAGVVDPDAFALRWIALFEGALTYRLLTGNDDAAREMRHVAEVYLAQSIGPPPADAKAG